MIGIICFLVDLKIILGKLYSFFSIFQFVIVFRIIIAHVRRWLNKILNLSTYYILISCITIARRSG